MSVPYQVFDTEVRRLLEGLPGRGEHTAYMLALTRQLERLDLDMSDVCRGLADVEDAAGPVLDIVGDILREPRGGLEDPGYRRILAGSRVARGTVSTARLWAGWVALTGGRGGSYDEHPPVSVSLSAQVSFTPTPEWVERAGAVVRRLIGASYQCNAVVYLPQSLRLDKSPGLDSAPIAYTLPVMGY